MRGTKSGFPRDTRGVPLEEDSEVIHVPTGKQGLVISFIPDTRQLVTTCSSLPQDPEDFLVLATVPPKVQLLQALDRYVLNIDIPDLDAFTEIANNILHDTDLWVRRGHQTAVVVLRDCYREDGRLNPGVGVRLVDGRPHLEDEVDNGCFLGDDPDFSDKDGIRHAISSHAGIYLHD